MSLCFLEYENIKEKSSGVFYFKSVPFLHFHDKDGKRWADVKVGSEWKHLEIDFKPSEKAKNSFLKSVQVAHESLIKKSRKV